MFPVFSIKIITKMCKKNNHILLRLFITNMFQIKLELYFKMLSKNNNTFGISQNLEVKNKQKHLNCLNPRNRPDNALRTMTRFDSRQKQKEIAKLLQKKLNQISHGSNKSNSKRNIIMLYATMQIAVKTDIHFRVSIKHPNFIQTSKIKPKM